ncbi:SDR family NAD(P)-dependent oxidoreductase [Streptomyces kanamyceticus]|uniref:SDR family NAD(P)-dependent oxidoreductase n=1 Tax=Streptomyces kanamyceticus TaxID=1967 RepID=A0A5J6GK50_STRKN|nr:SDR family NAD(P)-dependent oxidoreductase [Streptomyces kanamyceticus]QEU96280.1 SDR family NAD(P)-dependent oxidoreductase [Streptomyces kanamyceticus]
MTQLPVTEPPHESRVWFVTGASRGLGYAFTEAALAAGDRVVATARDVAALEARAAAHDGRLLALPLDVTRREDVHGAVERATAAFGRIDVVVNNAGQLLFGMVEETTEEQARHHLDTNFFGALWVTQAVLPVLRAQGSGHILQVTVAGAGGGSAATGLYGAGKAALNALSEALAEEVEPFGIKVTLLEPGPYDTGLGHHGLTATEPDPAYDGPRAALEASWADSPPPPSPALAAAVVLEVVGMDDPPRRLVLGAAAYDEAVAEQRERADAYTEWASLSRQGG